MNKGESRSSQNDVNAGVGVNEAAHLANLERIRRRLERLLHLARSKMSEVAAFLTRAALTILGCELLELSLTALNGLH